MVPFSTVTGNHLGTDWDPAGLLGAAVLSGWECKWKLRPAGGSPKSWWLSRYLSLNLSGGPTNTDWHIHAPQNISGLTELWACVRGLCLVGLIGTIRESFLVLHLGPLKKPVVMIEYYYQQCVGQMVSLGILKPQHLSKCVWIPCINQQLFHLSQYTLCLFNKGAIEILFIQVIIACFPLDIKQVHVMSWISFSRQYLSAIGLLLKT